MRGRYVKSKRRIAREAEQRRRQERAWAARSGPVRVYRMDPAMLDDQALEESSWRRRPELVRPASDRPA